MANEERTARQPSTPRGIPIYVSSPLPFTVPGRIFYQRTLLPVLAANGIAILDPWDLTFPKPSLAEGRSTAGRPRGAAEAAAMAIAERNQGLLDKCAGVFAVMDGVEVDSGVAAEIGYASARGVPIVGWRSDVRRAGEPIAAKVALQVEHFVTVSGGAIYNELDPAIRRLKQLARPTRGRVS